MNGIPSACAPINPQFLGTSIETPSPVDVLAPYRDAPLPRKSMAGRTAEWIPQAQAMLKSGKPIRETAAALGLRSPAYMNFAHKKLTGQSLAEFMRKEGVKTQRGLPKAGTPKPACQRPFRIIDGSKHFQCRGECGQWKREDEFYQLSNPLSRCGRSSECKLCGNARRAEAKLRAGKAGQAA